MSGGNTVDLEGLFDTDGLHMAEEIARLYMEWDSARVTAKHRWKETLQFKYATSTRETVNGNIGGFDGDAEDEDTGEGWAHSTHIPKIAEIADNLSATYMSTVYPNEDFFQFVGEDSEAVNKVTRNKLESYLKAKHRASKLRTVIQQLVDDFVDYGNCFAGVTYHREEDLPEEVDEGLRRVGYNGPRVYRISPMDIVFNPLATSFEEAPKIIRSIKTMGELISDSQDKPLLGYSEEAVNKAREVRSTLQKANEKDFDKYVQLQYDGFGSASQYFQSGFVEILEFYGDFYDITDDKFYKNHVITVMDRKFVLRSQPLNTWTGKPLIYHAGWRLRPDNLWAMGPLDNLTGMQFLINHLENARADAFDQMLAPTRVEVGDVERIDVEPGKPGGTYRITTGEGSVQNLLPDTTVLTADNQIMLKMEQMEQFAGLPKQELGVRTPGEKTYGEVQHLSRAASKVFKNKTMYLEALLENIINAELELARTINDIHDVVATTSEEGAVEFTKITKDDIRANGRLVPMGARHFERKQQLVQNFNFLQSVLSQDELALNHISSVKMAELYEELMDLDGMNVVTPYVRIGEQAEMMKLQQAVQAQLENEAAIDETGAGTEDVEDEPDDLEGQEEMLE